MNYTSFSAKPITGSGRGKDLGTPTINVHLDDVPHTLEAGIYAAYVRLTDTWLPAAVHYGPRPVFNDSDSFEVYVLDQTITDVPTHIDIALIKRTRDIMDFDSPAELQQRIEQDVTEIRAMLEEYGRYPSH